MATVTKEISILRGIATVVTITTKGVTRGGAVATTTTTTTATAITSRIGTRTSKLGVPQGRTGTVSSILTDTTTEDRF